MMLTDVVNTVQSLVEAHGSKNEPFPTDQKVSIVGRALQSLTPKKCAKKMTARSFPPLSLLWWASLLYGARAQRTDPFPAQFELSSLDGTNGFVVIGEESFDSSGFSVSCAGDLNGDGFKDLIIGAYQADPYGKQAAGKSYVVFGKGGIDFGGILKLSKLDGTNGFVLNGENKFDTCGFSVSGIGDINGDQIDDVAIGAPSANHTLSKNTGKTYVVLGNKGLGSGGTFELSSLNGTNGFILLGEMEGDRSGKSVSGVGDVNDDGIDDMIIGVPNGVPRPKKANSGHVYVIFGKRGHWGNGRIELSTLNRTSGLIIFGEQQGHGFGESVSGAGDVNFDGVKDLLIGAYGADSLGRVRAGITYTIFGRKNLGDSGNIDVADLDGKNGFRLICESAGDNCGRSVSGSGDINGDGLEDLIIGAYHASPSMRMEAGSSYIVYGKKGIEFRGNIDLSNYNGTHIVIFNGVQGGENSGKSVAIVPDMSGDGIDDIMIGANFASPSNRTKAGKTYLIFGSRDLETVAKLELANLNGINGFGIIGEAAGDWSGYSVSGCGDVNGDGMNDVLIGAFHANALNNFFASVGRTYVIFGRNLTGVQLPTSPGTSTKFISTSQTTTSEKTSSITDTETASFRSTTTDLLSYTPTNTSTTSVTSNPTTKNGLTDLTWIIPQHVPIQSSTNSTPLYIGIASAVTAVACSLLAGAVFFLKRRSNNDAEPDGTSLEHQDSLTDYTSIESIHQEMQSARVESSQSSGHATSIYDIINVNQPSGDYNKWPSKPAPHTEDQYTSIDKVERKHDEYAEAKFRKAHENYDDVNLEGGL